LENELVASQKELASQKASSQKELASQKASSQKELASSQKELASSQKELVASKRVRNDTSGFEVPSTCSDCSIIRGCISTVNKIICDRPFEPKIYEHIDTATVANNMSKLQVRWCRDANCGACQDRVVGHTERKRTTNIYLNFKLKRLCEGDNAIASKRTQFWMAVTIYHEIGHLLLRWQKINKTPIYFLGAAGPEAGEYCEIVAFGGVVHAEVVCFKSTSSTSQRKQRSHIFSKKCFLSLFDV
jgi:hypothetical protein